MTYYDRKKSPRARWQNIVSGVMGLLKPTQVKSVEPAPTAEPVTPVPFPEKPSLTSRTLTRKQNAHVLFTCRAWNELLTFKRSCKKSWSALGFTPTEIDLIKLHIGG